METSTVSDGLPTPVRKLQMGQKGAGGPGELQLFQQLQGIVVELSQRAIQDKRRIAHLERQVQEYSGIVEAQDKMLEEAKAVNARLAAERQKAHTAPPPAPERQASPEPPVLHQLREERRQRVHLEEQHSRMLDAQQRSIHTLEARLRAAESAAGPPDPGTPRRRGSPRLSRGVTPRSRRVESPLRGPQHAPPQPAQAHPAQAQHAPPQRTGYPSPPRAATDRFATAAEAAVRRAGLATEPAAPGTPGTTLKAPQRSGAVDQRPATPSAAMPAPAPRQPEAASGSGERERSPGTEMLATASSVDELVAQWRRYAGQ